MVEFKKSPKLGVLEHNELFVESSPEYPNFGAYRKRNKFVKILNDSVWDLPAPVNLNAW